MSNVEDEKQSVLHGETILTVSGKPDALWSTSEDFNIKKMNESYSLSPEKRNQLDDPNTTENISSSIPSIKVETNNKNGMTAPYISN